MVTNTLKSSRQVIATNLRKLMEKNKHSNCYLHRTTGLSQSTIGRVLKGEIATTVDTLDALAKVYGLSSWQMLIVDLDISASQALTWINFL